MGHAAPLDPAPAVAEPQWRALVQSVLKGSSVESLVSTTLDDVAIQPIYPKAIDPASWPMPGAVPWGIAQRVDHADPAEANRLALADLAGGADTLVLVLDGAPSAHGFGLDLLSLADLDTVLAGVDLGAITLRAEPGADAFRLAPAIMALAARRREGLETWRLGLGIDPVGTFAATGRMDAEWAAVATRMTGLLRRLREYGFTGWAFAVDGRPYAMAGASEAQELAAVLATGVATLRAGEANGMALEDVRDTLDFTLTADTDILLSVAKLRALRLLWQQVEQASGLAPKALHLHVETSWRMLTRRDPHTNLLRNAVAAFGAVLGGADSVAVLPYTAALGLSDEQGRRYARNAHHVFAAEANLWRVTDPVAGAGTFERLTHDLAARAWSEFQQIERESGIVASLRSGALQGRIAVMRARRVDRAVAGAAPIVGVTIFPDSTPYAAHVLSAPARPRPAPPRFADMAQEPGNDGDGGLACVPMVATRNADGFEEPEHGGGT